MWGGRFLSASLGERDRASKTQKKDVPSVATHTTRALDVGSEHGFPKKRQDDGTMIPQHLHFTLNNLMWEERNAFVIFDKTSPKDFDRRKFLYVILHAFTWFTWKTGFTWSHEILRDGVVIYMRLFEKSYTITECPWTGQKLWSVEMPQ